LKQACDTSGDTTAQSQLSVLGICGLNFGESYRFVEERHDMGNVADFLSKLGLSLNSVLLVFGNFEKSKNDIAAGRGSGAGEGLVSHG
jgi:hypothetical protein